MKKLAILSPLVLLATTSLAQDSTCILQPSCSQLGYTSAEADCGTAKVLRCPFDVSQVACLSSGNDGGSGAGGDNYNPHDPNNELGDAVVFELKTDAPNINFAVYVSGGGVIADCGGEITISSLDTISCSFSGSGPYIVKLAGDFKELSLDNASYDVIHRILKLDKSGITKMGKVCGENTVGIIPPLPSTLVDATGMFQNCESLTSLYPKLPNTLEIADYMFSLGSSSTESGVFSGDVELPSRLKSAKYMFAANRNLNLVSGLENTQIEDGEYMFGLASLQNTSITLPKTLVNGKNMFIAKSGAGCAVIGLENTKLVNAENMFERAKITSFTGLPNSLENGNGMFNGYSSSSIYPKMEAQTISALPNNLKSANAMFYHQLNLSGSVTMPSGLTRCSNIFTNSSITKSGTWTCN